MATPVKTRRIEIRVSEEEHAAEDAAARTLGVTARPPASARAEVLAERSRVVLDDDDAARFLEALDHPERFTEQLRRLADRPSLLTE